MDQNEDAYFSNMDEEEDTVTGDTQDSTASPSTSVDIDLPDKFSGSSPALVNYPDDDDDEDEILVRPKKEKTIKLSISLGGLTSTKSKSPVTMESAKGLVGEKVESEKRATSPPSSPLEFVKSSLNSMQEATALEEQQTLKKQRTL